MKKKQDILYNLFWIFVIASMIGWIIEGLWSFFKKGMLINHSAVVIGPFNMAYGFSACFFSLFLYKFRNDNNWKIFLVGFLAGSIAEYIMSLGMELILGFTAWDYSHKFLNINGRICFTYSLFWGLLSVIWIKYIYPRLEGFLQKINNKWGYYMTLILIIFLIGDVFLTALAVKRAKNKELGLEPKYKYEEILDKTFNKNYLQNMYNNSWERK